MHVLFPHTDCSATSSEDYTPGPYEVVFPPGVTKVTVTVGITPDNKCECDEKFTSQLRPPTSGNVSIGVNDTASITIVDDDGEYACMLRSIQ